MSRSAVGYAPAALTVGRAVEVLDGLVDLHARSLAGGPDGDEAFADLSDTVCLVLGQLLAVGPAAAAAVLSAARRSVEQHGMAGQESVLLSAYLAGISSSDDLQRTVDLLGGAGVLEQLAGGAARVPVADRTSMTVTTASLADLAVATRSAGGSAGALWDNLRDLVAADRRDDPALPAVAAACADGYVAVFTARRILDAGGPEPGDTAALAGAVDVGSQRWRGPAGQLLSGRSLPSGLGVAGAGEPGPGAAGTPRAGLAPRPRRGLPGTGDAGTGRQAVPARVTAAAATWVALGGSTAELHPPSELSDPSPVVAGPSGARRASGPDLTATRAGRVVEVGAQAMKVPGPGAPTLDPLTGAVIDATGHVLRPAPGSRDGVAVAEATLREAGRLGVDVSTETVAGFVDLLVARSG